MNRWFAWSTLAAIVCAQGCSSSDSPTEAVPGEDVQRHEQGIVIDPVTLITPTSTVPQVSAVRVSATPGGSLNAQMPLAVPPGAGGLTPQLSLSYDSSVVEDGLMGIGWNLSGLSAITRCAKTLAQDNAWGAVDGTSADRFCLDGRRLVLTAGVYGTHGAEYRTELDSISKIVQTGGATGPDSFTVWTKAGMKMEYGTTADSRVESNAPSNFVRKWALARASDTSGNYYTVTYGESTGTGEHIPLRIDYGGNTSAGVNPTLSIRFGYEFTYPQAIQVSHPPLGCAYISDLGRISTCVTSDIPTTSNVIAAGSCCYGPCCGHASTACPTAYTCPTLNVPFANWRNEYASGGFTRTTTRIKAIDAYVGTERTREWQLTYDKTSMTERSRLATLRECGWDGACTSPTRMNWSAESFGYTAPATWMPGNSGPATWLIGGTSDETTPLDLNGDGRSDLLQIRPDGTAWVALSTGTSLSLFTQRGTGFGPDRKRVTVGDVNGDSLPDLLLFDATGAASVWTSDGSTFTAKGVWATGLSTDSKRLSLGDVDGDGKIDVIDIREDGTIRLSKSTGTGFAPATTFGTGHANDPESMQLVDIDGDSRADVLQFASGQITFWLARGASSAVQTVSSTEWSGDSRRLRLADANGDGAPDVWRQENDGTLNVWLGTGAGFSTTGQVWSQGVLGPASLVDVNADGRSDLVYQRYWSWGSQSVQDPRRGYVILLSTGTHFDYAGTWEAATLFGQKTYRGVLQGTDANAYCSDFVEKNAIASTKGLYDCVWSAGKTTCSADCILSGPLVKSEFADFNGDGRPEFYSSLKDGTIQVVLSQLESGDRIVRISDDLGFGPAYEATYTPGANPNVYTKQSNAVTNALNAISSTPLLSTLSVSNGLGGWQTTSYRYEGLRTDLRGRGSLGFAKVYSTDAAGITTTTTYRQDFPYTGVVSSVVRKYGTKTLSTTSRSYASIVGTKRWLPYMTTETTTSADLNGTAFPRIVTSQVVDAFGNVTSQAVTTTSGTTVHSATTTSVFQNDSTSWLVGRLMSATTTHRLTGKPDVVRNTSYTYDSNGLLASETIEPGASIAQTTSFDHDAFGNRTIVTKSAGGISRMAETTYDPTGRFVVSQKNAAGHLTTFAYADAKLPLPTSTTDANGIVTSFGYNSFGEKLSTTRTGTTESTARFRCLGNCPSLARTYVQSDKTGQPRVTTYIDALGRDIRSTTTGYGGRTVVVDKEYDTLGRVTGTTKPSFAADSTHAADPVYWTRLQYDVLGRVTQQVEPDTATTTIAYKGLQIETTNPRSQVSIEVRNLLGKVARAEQGRIGTTAGPATTFDYDATGALLQTTDANGLVRSSTYDPRGLRTSSTDPDHGTRTYVYDGFGDLVTVTNGRGQMTTTTYDALGRIRTRTEPEGTTTYTYDTAVHGVGLLAKMDSPGVSRTVTYDAQGRVQSLRAVIGTQTLTTSTTYDAAGRVSTVTYPSGVVV